ncbi:MAG TPA: patatin-like phospholipase family protein [Chloroflexia bacterium]|jgi:NTE family protein
MNDAESSNNVQAGEGQTLEADEVTLEALAPVTRPPKSLGDEAVEAAPDDDETLDGGLKRPKPGIALCLSGGGYRAMLFHLGTLWRLNELGYVARLSRVSSVSGGSITAGALALAWHKLHFTGDSLRVAENFKEEVVLPVRGLADKTIDVWAVLRGLFWGGTTSTHVASYYNRYLFRGCTLQDLPKRGQGPDFVFNASNLQTGVLWQASRDHIGDYKIGWMSNPDISVAQAVAASSAFPPFLSPMVFTFDPKTHQFQPRRYSTLNKPPYTTNVLLTDGGVYDNLGLETAWKYFDTVLVSDGGGKMQASKKPGRDWVRQVLRVRDMTDNQVRALRKRQLMASYRAPKKDLNYRQGAYWGIRTEIADYELADSLPCDPKDTGKLADIWTRLGHLNGTKQEKLINWGYAICDAAIRRYVDRSLPPPKGFPYPESKV